MPEISEPKTKSPFIPEKAAAAIVLAAACAGLGAGYFSFLAVANHGVSAAQASDIVVSLAPQELPPVALTRERVLHDLRPLLTVTGNIAFNPVFDNKVAWEIVSGELPDGLEMEDGVITGLALEEGTFPIQIQATYLGKASKQTYQISVEKHIALKQGVELPKATTMVPYPRYALSNAVDVKSFEGAPRPGAYWMLKSGALPPGMMMMSGSGEIMGIPVAAGTYTFEASADSRGQRVQREFQIVVEDPPGSPSSAQAQENGARR